ncbi:MAG TPA: hypothetical protein VJM53_02010 [Burkholderiales bacterium]|nr:hypothetical protein [Burkholderiales bacterium]
MIKTYRNQRNNATNAAGLTRQQARNERRRRTSFWQFYRVEGEGRDLRLKAPATEASQR